jgi:hypothetical protein
VKSVADYVEYGSLATVPGPLRCEEVTQWCFPLQADPERLEELCRSVFAEPTGGEIDLRPLSSRVLLTLGRVGRIVSEQSPFSTMGWSPEGQAAIWVPVGRFREEGEKLIAQEMLMFTPYMWVDNPISLSSGREMYGFPKAFGWVELPAEDGVAGDLRLDVFGMDFEREEAPSRRPLVRITRGERVHELTDVAWSALRDIGRHLRRLPERDDGGSLRFGLHFAESMLQDARERGVRQVFLHQLRSVEDGKVAALQQVTEATYHVTAVRGAPLEHEYAIDLSPLDSHPIGRVLGLASQRTRHAFRTESRFVLRAGSVRWDASTIASAASGP